MKSSLDLARGLAAKAEHDINMAQIGFDQGAPLDTVCFHCQQAVEKLLKATLASKSLEYPYTHDVRILLDMAVSQFPELAEFREGLLGFSSYAVEMRYDNAINPGREETAEALRTAGRLRDMVHPLLPAEARPRP